ncbi:long-chain-fatty-acid--CoA ligase [Nocardioides sp. cx-173]|uniref:long-chain-fatty-acid--CoA ligase n=1 Tax=Nocardioides sp. cx-173 TaxID=2898796 RepID=UPI001E3AA181|nr:long-chain-fatty-acid--CoA ligase [Nocardioides sp. cx-173]MCD4525906.1 long-chain-fatty-acid--CoA ligase [Nocardioides sp. cx-173]UGB40057.1 long-chain-fatty-acid--CoA ligase [Nocardioides sp. cx-173]
MTEEQLTVRNQLLARRGDTRAGLLFGDDSWTWDEVVAASCVRSAVVASLLPAGEPPHVGVLLDNTPEFAFLLGGAALGGQVVVGLNPTRRGPALAADVARADCQVVVADSTYAGLLGDVDVPVLLTDGPAWAGLLAEHAGAGVPDVEVGQDDLMMLIFTSGTSGEPKAVNITQVKVAFPGLFLADRFGLGPGHVAYLSMPMFHSNAIMAGWAPALASGTTMALAPRFSASGFLADVRRYGATYANYVGKPLTYVMATPERPDDADNPLRIVFGNEANERDIDAFGRRFGCVVVDSYSSTENAVVVQRVPEMPQGSLGRPLDGVKVLDPVTMEETPDAEFGPHGELLNADAATGELVNAQGAGAFAGYYKDPDAESERMRGGIYWSGDLAYRDADGFVYFAGRTADWLRVDGENLAAAPIERILLRHPAISEAAVYAVPDESVGDQVMASLITLSPLGPDDLESFLADQPDLSPKAWPRYVRLVDSLPRTATNKVLKRQLSAAGAADPTWTRDPRGTTYR